MEKISYQVDNGVCATLLSETFTFEMFLKIEMFKVNNEPVKGYIGV